MHKDQKKMPNIILNGMEYVIWAKGPALGPVRPFSADRRKEERKKKQIEQEKSNQQN